MKRQLFVFILLLIGMLYFPVGVKATEDYQNFSYTLDEEKKESIK